MRLKSLLVLVLTAIHQAADWNYHERYVYYNPALTAQSAPYSLEHTGRRIVQVDPSYRPHRTYKRGPVYTRETRLSSVAPYRAVTAKRACDCYKPRCHTHNNLVKEVNRGAPRYVVNGSVTFCDEPEPRLARAHSNFDWSTQSYSPYYRKTPVYLGDNSLRQDEYVTRKVIRYAPSRKQYYYR